ncbi:MAG: type II toxin-antitoxin system Phd/YefM family antitoxin [Gemmatimonadetes bacterium]|nr:type II toxin-antitoxin system Phd/YefM family antitoxin [Gemmatimonadota bacterium]
MDVYTYSEARQKLASVLDKAESSGKVLIRRQDGRIYALVPERPTASPLDVPSIKADISTQEIVTLVRQERENKRVASTHPITHVSTQMSPLSLPLAVEMCRFPQARYKNASYYQTKQEVSDVRKYRSQ